MVDLRQRRDFAGRHLAGSVSVELGDPFATSSHDAGPWSLAPGLVSGPVLT
ncbi:MAG TPA: hypothetical protein VFV73_44075 [Streptosporangiaceae bacterium]|nr:hypothetical protein [Streptosporangiaceae bacterium]